MLSISSLSIMLFWNSDLAFIIVPVLRQMLHWCGPTLPVPPYKINPCCSCKSYKSGTSVGAADVNGILDFWLILIC